ncbi:Dedicator of cytokinesis protein 7 [Stylophora pistillata]|uniref:Dedicator of cytokinesis protein 7 n=1 Tax=Stylophora pistillata TaxID=50429 RepID=A0A2B4R5V0_STYPI|nr:Dedicator of cytokinesis protein 7 [Stylophora pistillata]
MQSATRTDPTSVMKHIDTGPDSSRTALANVINNAFLAPMNSFTPLDSGVSFAVQYTDTPTVTKFCVLKKLIALNPAKASGPDGVPAWLLKENADLLAPVVTYILNSPYLEARLPQSRKLANVAPILKQTPVYDVKKHLRPISLTPVLSKLTEDSVVDRYVKPAVLAKVEPRQFGTVPCSSTTEALISMTHAWYSATDGNGASVRLVHEELALQWVVATAPVRAIAMGHAWFFFKLMFKSMAQQLEGTDKFF